MESVTEKRLYSLDALRGIAIFGILLVNGPTLNSPVPMDGTDFAQKVGTANIWYGNFILQFAAGYFYPIFAMLFGVSAAIFLSKKGTINRSSLFARRLWFLLFFGILQVFFIWWGDVLIVYALFGFTLIPLASLTPRKSLYLLGAVMFVAVSLSVIKLGIKGTSISYPIQEALLTYQQGDFTAIFKQRLFDFAWCYIPFVLRGFSLAENIPIWGFLLEVYACFLIGFYLFSSGILLTILHDYKRANQCFLWLLLLNIIFKIIIFFDHSAGDIFEIFVGILRGSLYAIAAFSLLHQGGTITRYLSSVGKMSLSCYLLSNFLLSMAFYGYGLGLYGKIGPAEQLPILLVIMMINVIFSNIWLKYFQFGPLEWVWRILTYQTVFPILKEGHCVTER